MVVCPIENKLLTKYLLTIKINYMHILYSGGSTVEKIVYIASSLQEIIRSKNFAPNKLKFYRSNKTKSFLTLRNLLLGHEPIAKYGVLILDS